MSKNIKDSQTCLCLFKLLSKVSKMVHPVQGGLICLLLYGNCQNPYSN